MFLESFLVFAQHVSDLTEPIIRSTTVVYAVICFRFVVFLFLASCVGVLPHQSCRKQRCFWTWGTQVHKNQELWQLVVYFHSCPYINYSLQCANFHQTHLPTIVHCCISPRSRTNRKSRVEIKRGFYCIQVFVKHNSFNSCGLGQQYRILM
jgi:hypothetical protein